MNQESQTILSLRIQKLFPDAICAYLFGSATTSDFRDDSDIDVAVLQKEPVTPDVAIDLKSFASQKLKRDLDLVDLARADTVTIAQVVSTGVLLFCRDAGAVASFETTSYSTYALLNEERREILQEIIKTGRIHG